MDRAAQPTDASLLERVAGGDREAFRSLYERYQRRIHSYCLKFVRDPRKAEELTNDVMFEVWRGAAGFRGHSSPSTWILGIARHKALSEARRREEPVLPEPEEAHAMPDPAEGPAETAERADVARALRGALEKLSVEHREVLELTYYQELSCQEIAEVLQCPVGTVKTRMFYARQRLKAILAGTGIAGDQP